MKLLRVRFRLKELLKLGKTAKMQFNDFPKCVSMLRTSEIYVQPIRPYAQLIYTRHSKLNKTFIYFIRTDKITLKKSRVLLKYNTNFSLSPLQAIMEVLKEKAREAKGEVDVIVGLDARGFLMGPVMAAEIGVPFVPVGTPRN